MKLLPIKVEEVIEPEESAGCTGYDKDENALMVPMEGSNKIKVKIAGAPADLLAKMKFISEPAGKLTIDLQVPTAAEQELNFSGTVAELGVKVKLEIDGTKIDLFEADVLERLEKTIELHVITEQNDDVQSIAVGANGAANAVCVSAGANGFRDTIPGGDDAINSNNITVGPNGVCDTTANNQNLVPINVSTAASLQSYLNRKTWGNQANVHFTVTRTDHVVNYDLNRNGGLADSPLDEALAINAVASNVAADYNVFYVNTLEVPQATTVISLRLTWIQDSHANNTENVSAHEVGHLLGISYEATETDTVMFGEGLPSNPCRVARKHWRDVDP